MNWGSIVGIDKYILKLLLQIREDVGTAHNDQLFNLNCQDIASSRQIQDMAGS